MLLNVWPVPPLNKAQRAFACALKIPLLLKIAPDRTLMLPAVLGQVVVPLELRVPLKLPADRVRAPVIAPPAEVSVPPFSSSVPPEMPPMMLPLTLTVPPLVIRLRPAP